MKYLLLALAILTWSCQENTERQVFSDSVAAAPEMLKQSAMPQENTYEVKRLDVQLVVDDLPAAESWVKEKTKSLEGKVTAQTHFNELQSRSSHLIVQIPANQVDTWMAALEAHKGWKVNGKQLSATSIHRQYVDHAQRLKTRQALEQRYTTLLQQAKSMADVLAIEEKLLTLRSEIEWMQTEKGQMDTQIAYVECSLRLEEQLSAWKKLRRQSANQFREGWHVLVNLLLFLLRIWPLLLLGAGGYWVFQKQKAKTRKA